MLSIPYVTENRRVNILLPVRVRDRETVTKFLQEYKTECLEKKEKIFLMLVMMIKLLLMYIGLSKGILTIYFQGADIRLRRPWKGYQGRRIPRTKKSSRYIDQNVSTGR